MVVGCSGGSIYASVMALGYDPETCERLTRELWTPKVTLRRDWRSMLGALMPRLFGFDGHLGMVHDGPLLEALEPPFGGKTFEQTKRSEERRVGKECVSTCRSRWSPDP